MDTRFDRLVRLASMVTGSPTSMISLLTSTRQWFKARVGVAARETPRDWAFCSHAIMQNELFVVEDALADDRFREELPEAKVVRLERSCRSGRRILDAARSTGIPLSVTAQAEEAALASLDAEDELLERVRHIAARRDAQSNTRYVQRRPSEERWLGSPHDERGRGCGGPRRREHGQSDR